MPVMRYNWQQEIAMPHATKASRFIIAALAGLASLAAGAQTASQPVVANHAQSEAA